MDPHDCKSRKYYCPTIWHLIVTVAGVVEAVGAPLPVFRTEHDGAVRYHWKWVQSRLFGGQKNSIPSCRPVDTGDGMPSSEVPIKC